MLDSGHSHAAKCGVGLQVVLITSSEIVSERGRLVLRLRLRNKGSMQVNRRRNVPAICFFANFAERKSL